MVQYSQGFKGEMLWFGVYLSLLNDCSFPAAGGGVGRAVIAHSCPSWTLPFLSSAVLLSCYLSLYLPYLLFPSLFVLFICKTVSGMAEVDTHPWCLSVHVLHPASFACLCGFVFVRTHMHVSKCVYVRERIGLRRGQ